MADEFNAEQKRYLEGFASGIAAARTVLALIPAEAVAVVVPGPLALVSARMSRAALPVEFLGEAFSARFASLAGAFAVSAGVVGPPGFGRFSGAVPGVIRGGLDGQRGFRGCRGSLHRLDGKLGD